MSEVVHRHAWDRPACEAVGAGVCLRPVFVNDESLIGYIVGHDVPDSADGRPWPRCEGFLPVACADPEKRWTVDGSLGGGDLTLSPDIQCKRHPEFHGSVRDGEWVPA